MFQSVGFLERPVRHERRYIQSWRSPKEHSGNKACRRGFICHPGLPGHVPSCTPAPKNVFGMNYHHKFAFRYIHICFWNYFPEKNMLNVFVCDSDRYIFRVGFWQDGFFRGFLFSSRRIFSRICRRIIPRSLWEKKCPEKSFGKIPSKILQNLYKNPRQISAEGPGQTLGLHHCGEDLAGIFAQENPSH